MAEKKSDDFTLTTKRKRNAFHHWQAVAVVFFSFIAAFFGAWAAFESGVIEQETSTEQSSTVISQEGDVLADIAEKVSPSVVSVVTSQTEQGLFGPSQSEGSGTGIIVSSDGYVLTNKHVIPEDIEKVSVVLPNGETHEDVEVIGRDPSNDIAFLKINNASNLTAAELGNSDEVKVGQKVVAVGNALGQFQNTVTQGIISGIGRPITAGNEQGADNLTNLFQTDAAINPGNSGGPLLDINGKVIGINTAIVEDAQGIGFAIPINDAKGLLEGVLKEGKVVKPFLGVQYINLTPSNKKQLKAELDYGALVYAGEQNPVVPDSPADKADIQSGDIITKVNDQEINNRSSLAALLNYYRPGNEVTLTIFRDGKEQTVTVTLDEYR